MRWFAVLAAAACNAPAASGEPVRETGLLFYLSGSHGTEADVAAPGTQRPNFEHGITPVADGAVGPGLSCRHTQVLSYWAPGNVYAQRGTLAFFWRAREPVGPTELPIFRVAFADHSSWDMVWSRIDYNGHGFDAFVTDANLARTRVSVTVAPFPPPQRWIHLALAWDETRGIRFFVDGRLAAAKEARALLDTGLDQLGPHSRIIAPLNVQSDYNFVRGGDIDEVRVYDRVLDAAAVAALARGQAPRALAPLAARDLADARVREAWYRRYGWNQPGQPPPYLDAAATRVRKVEIHDARDLGRWWWKANDGIPETTWPGVYNRSSLPGRRDYFILPDWDCYSTSGRAINFTLPDEPWNQLQIAGAAWGKLRLLARGAGGEGAGGDGATGPTTPKLPLSPVRRGEDQGEGSPASGERRDRLQTPHCPSPRRTGERGNEGDGGREGTDDGPVLFERPSGRQRTFHRLPAPITGGAVRFESAAPEQPLSELSAFLVTPGAAPTGTRTLRYRMQAAPAVLPPELAPLGAYIDGRHPPDERARLWRCPTQPGAPHHPALPPRPLPLPLRVPARRPPLGYRWSTS